MALRHVVSTLTLEQATTIATRAIEAGRRERMLPLAVVVVDSGGQIVTLQRDDGCGTLRVRIAQGKARGALGMGIPSRTIRDRLQNRPASIARVAMVVACSSVRVETTWRRAMVSLSFLDAIGARRWPRGDFPRGSARAPRA